jgi:hypothetical protein
MTQVQSSVSSFGHFYFFSGASYIKLVFFIPDAKFCILHFN